MGLMNALMLVLSRLPSLSTLALSSSCEAALGLLAESEIALMVLVMSVKPLPTNRLFRLPENSLESLACAKPTPWP
ncbi:hypothetical protein D3C72_1309890 [compost metagenome]